MRIKIILVHYGQLKPTIKLLDQLKEFGLISSTVVVNNSKNPVVQKLKKIFKKISLINNHKNLGYAKAINKVIKNIINKKNNRDKTDYILILNNNLQFKNNIIPELIAYSKNNKTDLVCPKILDEKGRIWFTGGEIDKKRFTAGHTPGKLDYLPGCCLLIKGEVFRRIGLFDEKYFLYYEDVDFCHRAKKAGFKLGLAQDLVVIHHTNKTLYQKKIMEYYLARNHLIFVKKLAPLRVKIRELIRLPKTLFDHWQKKEFEAIKGIKDALFKKENCHPKESDINNYKN